MTVVGVCNRCRKEPCWCSGLGSGGVIQTSRGEKFHPLDPQQQEINIIDIAHALSMQCRFTGHTQSFYSVSQHSVYVSRYCDPEDAMWGLLHDASEAYIADVSRPVKHLAEMEAYRKTEANLMLAICRKFGLSEREPWSVKEADNFLVEVEARDLMSPEGMKWKWSEAAIRGRELKISRTWLPEEAKERFLLRFNELSLGS